MKRIACLFLALLAPTQVLAAYSGVYTQNSVLFVGANGLPVQDNANLSWNDTTYTLSATNLIVSGLTSTGSLTLGYTGTACGTVTLTSNAVSVQNFTSGSPTATVTLPNATTLIQGANYILTNGCGGALTVKTNGGSTLYTIPSGGLVNFILASNSFAAGQWQVSPYISANSTWGTAGATVGTLVLTTGATFEVNGHIRPGGSAPTVSSCGSGTLTTGSTDQKGQITGIASATACTLTFASALPSAPSCIFSNSASTSVGISSISTTAVTASMTSLTGSLYYICF